MALQVIVSAEGSLLQVLGGPGMSTHRTSHKNSDWARDSCYWRWVRNL